MQYRELGNTGEKVSVLSLGASPFGGVFREVSRAECDATLRAALDGGINLIDVSPYYGITRAEAMLGELLPSIPRDSYLLATKVGRYGEDEFDFSAERAAASVDESLARMGVDHVDFIQCHDIEFGSLDQVIGETLPALRKIQQQGKARFVGVTGLPLKIFEEVAARAEIDTVLSYCHYSLNDDSLTSILPMLGERGVGVINASPLSMGLLSNRGAPPWHPAPDEIKACCARAAARCRERGTDIAKLAVQYSVRDPRVHTTLVGAANPEHIRNNIQWIGEPIDEELLDEVRGILAPVKNRTWPSGRPENN